MYKLTSFGTFSYNTSQITQLALDDPGEEVVWNYIRLPNGTIHDMDGTSASTTRPAATITSRIRIKGDTDADLWTLYNTILANRGVVGTLTRESNVGTASACTARLIQVPEVGAISVAGARFIDLTLIYAPRDKWT